MPLFYLKYTINESSRSDCMTLFGGMTVEDDKKDMGEGVSLVGRWSTVAESAGYCICEAKDAVALNKWLLNWSPQAIIQVFPVVDDNQARKIILDKTPEFQVDYSQAGAEAKPGESLYVIEYTFLSGKRTEGFATFAKMSEEQDKADAGKNTCLGRWHNIGTGSGIAVCSSPSEVDLYTWAFHWSAMCDCVVRPVVSDKDCRANLQAQPGFQKRHAALMAKLR